MAGRGPMQDVELDPVDGSEMWRSPLPDDVEIVDPHLHLMLGSRSGTNSSAVRFTVIG